MRKRFDRQLFDENDSQARHVVSQYLQYTRDCMVQDNPDIYGVDLLMTGALGDITAIEVEVKRVWKEGPGFPWDCVQLPERKRRYMDCGYPIEYWILNNTLEYAIVIPGSAVARAIPVEIPNKYVSHGELFVQIPINECSMRFL